MLVPLLLLPNELDAVVDAPPVVTGETGALDAAGEDEPDEVFNLSRFALARSSAAFRRSSTPRGLLAPAALPRGAPGFPAEAVLPPLK